LFGAIGSPEYESIPGAREGTGLLRMRTELNLYINLRPVKALPALAAVSPIKPQVLRGTDLVIVRELVGGIYVGMPRGIETADGMRRGINTMVYSEPEIERIARAAFQLARTRDGRVCSVDKSNVLETGRLWREVVQRLHDADYRDVALSHLFVDNTAMQLVRAPSQFDVLLMENLFGDILSDVGAAVAGSIGMLPSASMNGMDAGGQGRHRALYEPIHGSAPDIAGKGIANPCGAILSFAMCLRHTFLRPDEAAFLETAVVRAIESGARTLDIALPGQPSVSTAEMGNRILRELDAMVAAPAAADA
jgi:3-isopropylmalate dehydrogenase